MNDTNNPAVSNNQKPDSTLPQEPPPMPPDSPTGSFVLADVPNTVSEVPPHPVSSPPQMTVETVPDQPVMPEEPQPASPVSGSVEPSGSFVLDPTSMQNQETVVIPSQETTQFVPQGLVPDEQSTSTTFTAPPPAQPKRNPLKWILLLFVVVLIGVGVFFGMRFGGQYIEGNKEVTLNYWGLWENESIIRPIIDKFESENPNIKIQYTKQNYRQYRERLQSAIERGEGPDVFRFHATWIPMLRNEIEPVPEEVVSPGEFTASYYDVVARDLLAGTTLWGIPISIDGLGLYINEDLFATAGVSVPTSYQDLLTVVPQLTVKNGNDIITSAIALGTTNNVEHFSDILGLLILQNGGQLVTPTGPEAEEALVFYKKFATPSDPLYTWNDLQDNSVSAFANGRVAMMIAPSWRAFDLRQMNPNLRFRIEPVPQLPGSSVAWASYWVEGVSAKSTSKDQAFTFLKYLTSKESASLLYAEAGKARLFGPPYALKELGAQIESDPYVGAYINQAPFSRSFPLSSKTHDGGLNDQMIKYLEDAVNAVSNGTAPTQALQTMSQGFQQVLSQYGLASNR